MENPLYKLKSYFFQVELWQSEISLKNKIMIIIILFYLGNIHLSCMKFNFQIPTWRIAYYIGHVGYILKVEFDFPSFCGLIFKNKIRNITIELMIVIN
jgi:hypothetical protein